MCRCDRFDNTKQCECLGLAHTARATRENTEKESPTAFEPPRQPSKRM